MIEFWKKLGVLKELTVNQQYRKLLGTINAEALDRIIIKIREKKKNHNKDDDIGNTREASIAKKEVMVKFSEKWMIYIIPLLLNRQKPIIIPEFAKSHSFLR